MCSIPGNINTKKKKHIAIMGIKGLPAKGGGERVAEVIIHEALQNGIKVTLYTKKSYFEPIHLPENMEIKIIRDFPGKHLNAFLYGMSSALHALLFKNYDLIHLHYADFGYLIPLLKLKFKVVVTSHGAEYHRDKWNFLAKWFFKLSEIPFLRLSNVCTSVSRTLAEYYQKKYKKKVLYIPNGVTYNNLKYSSGDILKKYDLVKDGYMLFCAGRIIPSKGCDLLLKANSQLKTKVPLVIIGDMNGNDSYKRYLMELFEPNVKVIEFIKSKEELGEIVSHCRFFVFPSTYEAMSMMLLEVAALRKPIVCSDLPENLEAIGRNAVFFQNDNIDSLRENLGFCLKHPEKISELGEKAFDWVKKNRDWREIANRYIEIYRTI